MPILTDDQLQEVLVLLRGADSVELKLTIPDDARSRVLDRAGVVVRARRIQDAAADTTVKLRPVVPDELPKSLRRDPAFTVEVDAMPGGFVCSGSLKDAATNDEVLAAATGRLRLRKLLGKPQRALFAEHAPDGIALDDLAVLGPINVLKLKMIPKTFGRKITVELWNYPDGERILELSTKCAPAEAFQVAAEIRARVAASELDLSGKQQTKTKAALRYFSKQLTA